MPTTDRRPFSPSAARNGASILTVLQRVLPVPGPVLELGSGTGEHAVHFSRHLPALRSPPSDADRAALASIADWVSHSGLPKLLLPCASSSPPCPGRSTLRTSRTAPMERRPTSSACSGACGGGAVIRGIPGDGYKVHPEGLRRVFATTNWGDAHHSQPSVLSLTCPTDFGTVYTPAEVHGRTLATTAKSSESSLMPRLVT